MKRVECFQTRDGKIFQSEREAFNHAEDRYGALLTSLAHQLVHIHKYTDYCEFIQNHILDFVELNKLGQDCHLEENSHDPNYPQNLP